MIYLLELIPVLGLLLVITPLGTTAMAAFFGLVGILGRGKSADKHAEAKVGGFSFKGPVRFGVIILAIIFAYIAMQESGQSSVNPSPDKSSFVDVPASEKSDAEARLYRAFWEAILANL